MLGYPSLLVNSPFDRLRRILEVETRWERMATDEGDRAWASEHHDRRKQAIHSFLTDPGYCHADTICKVRQLAPDLFGERQCTRYLTETWPNFLDVLKRDALLHALTVGCPLASVAELDRTLEARFFIASLPCWQKPVGWVVVPLAFPRVLRWRRKMRAATSQTG